MDIPASNQPTGQPAGIVLLRDVTEEDLPIFYEHQRDPEAVHMSAFKTRDRDAFMAHWAKILANESAGKQTILFDGQVAGNVVNFEYEGKREVGYWIGREYWGKGIASRALAVMLRQITTRPLYATAARDNAGSIRVLQKCGFIICGEQTSFSQARGEVVEEVNLILTEGGE